MLASLTIYGLILSGWGSNSQYSFLGAVRATAQMISYEVSIGLIIISVLLCVGNLNIREIVIAQFSDFCSVINISERITSNAKH